MASDPGPAVQRLLLGEDLRELREVAHLNSDDAAEALGWYRAKVSKVETGSAKLSDKEIERLIEVYEVNPERAEQLRRLAREARRKLPATRVPDWAAKYVNLEGAADDLKLFFGDFVPGCLQTRNYAKALLATSVLVAPAEIEQAADDREARARHLMRNDGPLVWIILGEEALRRPVGGTGVLVEQLYHLRAMSELPNFNLQVVPLNRGAHPALGMTFVILTVDTRSIVYVESLTSSDYLPRPAHVKTYGLVFGRLQAFALDRDESRTTIDQVIAEFE